MQHFLDLWLVTDVVLGLSLDACCSCFLNQVRFCVFYEKGKGEKIIRSVFPLSYNKQGTTYNQWSRKLLIKQRCNLKKSIFAIKCQRLASAGRKMVPFSPMKGGGKGGLIILLAYWLGKRCCSGACFFFFFFFGWCTESSPSCFIFLLGVCRSHLKITDFLCHPFSSEVQCISTENTFQWWLRMFPQV